MAFVEFQNVGKTYHMGEVEINALRDASFTVEKGELVVIVGPSGAGKTTLLNILGGMDTLSTGKVFLDGREISNLNKKQLTQYRRKDVGFVFQFYNLIGNLTALEKCGACQSDLRASAGRSGDSAGGGPEGQSQKLPQPAVRR